jgi:hypothetical protein
MIIWERADVKRNAHDWHLDDYDCAGQYRLPFSRSGTSEAARLTMDESERPKEKRPAEELAAMIHADLSHMDGCPQQGVSVTVYGIPWKAMLTFGAAAGPVRNKAELEVFFLAITERLQRLYEVD